MAMPSLPLPGLPMPGFEVAGFGVGGFSVLASFAAIAYLVQPAVAETEVAVPASGMTALEARRRDGTQRSGFLKDRVDGRPSGRQRRAGRMP